MLDTKPETSFKGGRGEGSALLSAEQEAAALLNYRQVGGSMEEGLHR